MRIALFILFLTVINQAYAQQYYLRGQVKDEKNTGIQNVSIRLQSSGRVFQTGADGYFGIVSAKAFDSASFYFSGYDTTVKILSSATTALVVLKSNSAQTNAAKHSLYSLTANLKAFSMDQWMTNETYSSTIENSFIRTKSYPVSEVRLHYNRASYSNIRRFLNQKEVVPPDAVRIEEMLNYFDWPYEAPGMGETFRIRTALTPCLWKKDHKLLLLNICSRKIDCQNLAPSHLVFLIDASGSMELPNRLPLLKSAFKMLVKHLRSKDTVSIVAYGGSTRVLANGISGVEKERLTGILDSLEAGGSTPGGSGIKTAYNLARQHFIKGGNNRVILATDGDFNVGVRNEDELEKLILQEKEKGLYLTCLGVGMGNYKDSKIQTLAQKGSGNFAYLDSYAEAEKVLFREFFQTVYTVADEALLSVHFNPAHVQQYKLLGFDNKLVAARDSNAVVMGGEVGAGNSLMIAFEINPTDEFVTDFNGNIGEVRLHYKEQGKCAQYEYAIPLGIVNNDRTFQLANDILLFGLKLKHSPEVKRVKWDVLTQDLKTTIDNNNFTEREFAAMVLSAKKIYARQTRFNLFHWWQ